MQHNNNIDTPINSPTSEIEHVAATAFTASSCTSQSSDNAA